MTTVEQIQALKFSTDLFGVKCVICDFPQGWNDYYGNVTCKVCIKFFLHFVISRKVSSCPRSGDCFRFQSGIWDCVHCIMVQMYLFGLKASRVGIVGKSCYMKQNECNLHKVDTMVPISEECRKEVKYFRMLYQRKMMICTNWLYNHPLPRAIRKQKRERPKIIKKLVILELVSNSLHAHDVLMLGSSYCDPFKIRTRELQQLYIHILKITRKFKDIFPNQYTIDFNTKQLLIYGAEQQQSDISDLRDKLITAVRLYNVFDKVYRYLPPIPE
ncbi:uncharacterized protein [Centruroides vittatus]|uniref:uncharacterized protein isoform X1 n=1 Tax=Centruroides vittatus TaxID=120091 RepID=UPI00350EAB10